MALGDLSSRAAVAQAIQEFDSLGRERFLTKYRFRRARNYFLIHQETITTQRQLWALHMVFSLALLLDQKISVVAKRQSDRSLRVLDFES